MQCKVEEGVTQPGGSAEVQCESANNEVTTNCLKLSEDITSRRQRSQHLVQDQPGVGRGDGREGLEAALSIDLGRDKVS